MVSKKFFKLFYYFVKKRKLIFKLMQMKKDAYKLLTMEDPCINFTNLYDVLSKMFSISKLLFCFVLFLMANPLFNYCFPHHYSSQFSTAYNFVHFLHTCISFLTNVLRYNVYTIKYTHLNIKFS